MWSHGRKDCHSTQARVSTVGCTCKNLVFRGWLKWCGAVVIPQGTLHGGYTSTIDLHKAFIALGRNACGKMTLSIVDLPKQGSTLQVIYAKIWYSEAGWSGVVPLPYPKTHSIVDLHPIFTYKKPVQLQETMHVVACPSVLYIHPSKVQCGLAMLKSGIQSLVEVMWGHCHSPRHIPWRFFSNIDLHNACAASGSNGGAHPTLDIEFIHPNKGHCSLGIQKSGNQRVFEVVWCRCHTPRHMPELICIQYRPTQILHSSRKQYMWPHDPQYCPSTQARVSTIGCLCKRYGVYL